MPNPVASSTEYPQLAIQKVGRGVRTGLYVVFLLGALVLAAFNLFGMDPKPLNLLAVLMGAGGTILVMIADVTAGLNLYAGKEPKIYPRVSGWTRVVGTAALLAAAFYAIVAAFNAF